MRLAILSHGIYPDAFGGVHVAVFKFAKFLQKKPVKVALLLNDVKNPNLEMIKDLKIYPAAGGHKRFISPVLHLISFFYNLVKLRPDVIFVLGIFSFTLVGTIYAKLFQKKIIVRSEGLDIELIPNFIDLFMKKLICEHTDQVLSVSYEHLPHILRFNPKNYPRILMNGADPQNIDLRKKEEKDHFLLLFVGRLDAVKNLGTLLQAFQKVMDQRGRLKKEIHLTLCGDGPERGKLEQMTKNLSILKQVNFSGFLKHEELNLLYEKADIFVLPSVTEGFPLVIAEALSFGCPIVCSALPNLTKVLVENENCLFFNPPTSSDELAHKVFSLLSDDNLRKKLEINNIQLSKKFTWETIGEELWKILINL